MLESFSPGKQERDILGEVLGFGGQIVHRGITDVRNAIPHGHREGIGSWVLDCREAQGEVDIIAISNAGADSPCEVDVVLEATGASEIDCLQACVDVPDFCKSVMTGERKVR